MEGTIAMPRECLPLGRLGALGFTLFLPLALASRSGADVIFKGTGAWAYADAVDQDSQQTGTAPAVVGGSATIHYTHFDVNQTPGTTTASFEADASANPGAADLLQLHAFFSSPGAGSIVGATQPGAFISESANWSNVAATVSGPAGSSLPSSLRLEFQVNYNALNSWGFFPTQSWESQPQALLVNGYRMTLTDAGVPLQSGEQPVRAQPDGSLTGTFHLDLPLSSSGTSHLFSLGLSSDHWGLLYPGGPVTIQGFMSLSLAGIYLPDGTPIAQGGYNVTFDSGLTPPPTPVPEPATWAAWCLMTAFGARVLRRRSHRGPVVPATDFLRVDRIRRRH
jgi:hypothetical protein